MNLSRSGLLILSAMLLFGGCTSLIDDSRISEGVIEYDVSYPKLDETSILAELLPNKMTMSFRDNYFMTDLTAGFGMFRMNVVSNGDDKELIQMVKLINERLVVKYDEETAKKSIEKDSPKTIKLTENTKQIAGFLCKEAVVTVLTEPQETYNVYYTEEIRIEEPNWFTQLTSINGVMLEYQVERYGLCSRFTATSVVQQEVDDAIFEVPEDYVEIDETQMDKKMEEIFNSLSE